MFIIFFLFLFSIGFNFIFLKVVVGALELLARVGCESVLAREFGWSLDTRVRSHLVTSDKVVKHFDPRVMAWDVIIELGGHFFELGKSVTGNVRKIVMLVVVAHVESDQI